MQWGSLCFLLTAAVQMHLEGVEGAAEDKKTVVTQRCYHPQSGQIADQVDLADTGVVIDHLRGDKGRG